MSAEHKVGATSLCISLLTYNSHVWCKVDRTPMLQSQMSQMQIQNLRFDLNLLAFSGAVKDLPICNCYYIHLQIMPALAICTVGTGKWRRRRLWHQTLQAQTSMSSRCNDRDVAMAESTASLDDDIQTLKKATLCKASELHLKIGLAPKIIKPSIWPQHVRALRLLFFGRVEMVQAACEIRLKMRAGF